MTQKKIGPNTYDVKPLSVLDSFMLEPMLAPAVGQALGLVLQAIGNDEDLSLDKVMSLSVESVIAIAFKRAPWLAGELGKVLGAIKPIDMRLIVQKLLNDASVDRVGDGKVWQPLFSQGEEPFNTLLQGRTKDRWQLLILAIGVNYPDFFARGGGVSAPPETPASPSPSPV